MSPLRVIDLEKFIPNYNLEKERCLDCFLSNIFEYHGIVVQAELTRRSNIKQISTTNYQKRDLSLLIQLKKERVYSLNSSCADNNCKYKHDEIILKADNKQEIHHFTQRLILESKYHFN